MKEETIIPSHGNFEPVVHVERDTGVELWLARDLQGLPGVFPLLAFCKQNGSLQVLVAFSRVS
jgi:hypothetical protein